MTFNEPGSPGTWGPESPNTNNPELDFLKLFPSLRDWFASQAPETIPPWFKRTESGLGGDDESSLQMLIYAQQDTYFRWRYYYADKMMLQRNISTPYFPQNHPLQDDEESI